MKEIYEPYGNGRSQTLPHGELKPIIAEGQGEGAQPSNDSRVQRNWSMRWTSRPNKLSSHFLVPTPAVKIHQKYLGYIWVARRDLQSPDQGFMELIHPSFNWDFHYRIIV